MAWLAGERITAARLNEELGLDWVDYSPTWTTSGTQPVIGNGKLKGRWTRVGGLIRARITLIAGTTMTFGTNSWSFGLPVTAAADADFGVWPLWDGTCRMRDVSAFAYFDGTAVVSADGNGVAVVYTGGALANNSPFTWSATATSGSFDNLSINVGYEPA
jgi:hypothetical protein